MARQEKEPKTEFASRLSRIRKLLGFQRDMLAAKLHISSQGLGNYERGDRTPDAFVLQAYAEVFNINLNWLIVGKGTIFLEDKDTIKRPLLVDAELLEKLAKLAMTICQETNTILPPIDFCSIVGELYNDLQMIIEQKNDPEEVEAALPILRLRLKRRLTKHINH